MTTNLDKLALGGGCHWCTEAIFQSLKGVEYVEQGYVDSTGKNDTFSEAVIVHYQSQMIPLDILIKVHLYTHKSTSKHSMRSKYRSAVYTFSEAQQKEVKAIIENFQTEFNDQLITEVLPFKSFKASRKQITNYYYNNPEKPFCETFINPKLQLLLRRFSAYTNHNKLKHLNNEKYKTQHSE